MPLVSFSDDLTMRLLVVLVLALPLSGCSALALKPAPLNYRPPAPLECTPQSPLPVADFVMAGIFGAVALVASTSASGGDSPATAAAITMSLVGAGYVASGAYGISAQNSCRLAADKLQAANEVVERARREAQAKADAEERERRALLDAAERERRAALDADAQAARDAEAAAKRRLEAAIAVAIDAELRELEKYRAGRPLEIQAALKLARPILGMTRQDLLAIKRRFELLEQRDRSALQPSVELMGERLGNDGVKHELWLWCEYGSDCDRGERYRVTIRGKRITAVQRGAIDAFTVEGDG